MRSLQVDHAAGAQRFRLYSAGHREGAEFFGLFPRDLLSAALMLEDPELLRESVRFSAWTIGRRCDPISGEEPGRVLHEWTRVERDGLRSHYNAAETSQLFLIATDRLRSFDALEPLLEQRWLRDAMVLAGAYIHAHLRDDLFWEDPARCGADRYFAYATYWKDSHLPARKRLDYPVAYTLVQAQTVAALRALSELAPIAELPWTGRELRENADRGAAALRSRLWDATRNAPLIGIDNCAPITGLGSDALHMLRYLEPHDLTAPQLAGIQEAAHALESTYGYRSYAPGQTDYADDAYHLGSIWPYEQVFIADGALRFDLNTIVDRAARVLAALEQLGFPELLVWDGVSLSGGGCDTQLWSCAVPQGFARICRTAPAVTNAAQEDA
jgi:glycogen debranching enzyme